MLLQVPCCKHPSSRTCPSSGQSEPSMVIRLSLFFRISKSSFTSGVQSQRVSFFSSLPILSVFLDRLLINFDRCCIEPRKDLSSLAFFGGFSFYLWGLLYRLCLLGVIASGVVFYWFYPALIDVVA